MEARVGEGLTGQKASGDGEAPAAETSVFLDSAV